MPEKELLDGLARVKGTRLTLKGDQATVEATLAVANLGVSSNLTGWIKADGKYSLEATASFKVAGFQVNGGKMSLGDKLNVNFTVPISSFGNVTFTGSYGPTGWSVQGTSPVTVQLGIVTLKQITFGVTRDSQTGDLMILRAKGTIASINGIVDATATAKVYTDGRINLDVTADALKVGTFTVGKSQVTVRNDTPAGRSVYVATLSGEVSIPGVSSPVKLTGEVDSRGNYTLNATQTIRVAGLTLSSAKVTLTKSGGLSVEATWFYAGITFNVNGTATANGRIQLEGTANPMKLPSGFTLGNISAKVDLNLPANSYMLNITGTADVLVAKGTFEAKANWDGKGTPTTALTLTAQVGGALAALFTGSATFTIHPNYVSFEGKLGFKPVTGLTVTVTGTIKSDGTLVYTARDSAGQLVAQMWNDGVKQVEQLYNKGKVVAETIVQNGVKIAEKAWKGGVTTLNIVRDTAGTLVSEYWRDGTKEFRNLYTNGVRTSYTVWENGTNTVHNVWNTAGQRVSRYWRDGAREISQWFTNGVVSAETIVQNGVKIAEKAWKGGVTTLNIVRDTAGTLVSEYWRNGTKEFRNLYTNGVRTSYTVWENGTNTVHNVWNTSRHRVTEYWRDGAREFTIYYKDNVRVAQNIWENGNHIAKHTWDTAGNYLGNALSNTGNAVKEYLGKIGIKF